MADTFRRGRIEDYVTRIRVRKSVLKNQLEQQEFKDQRDFIRGELRATELVIEELKKEFDIVTPDNER